LSWKSFGRDRFLLSEGPKDAAPEEKGSIFAEE
jgi:hypothetical protein